jgi:hypothetical protein
MRLKPDTINSLSLRDVSRHGGSGSSKRLRINVTLSRISPFARSAMNSVLHVGHLEVHYSRHISLCFPPAAMFHALGNSSDRSDETDK